MKKPYFTLNVVQFLGFLPIILSDVSNQGLEGCNEVNVNYVGDDISSGLSTQRSWERCRLSCRISSSCTHWTFRIADGNCWLKTGNHVKNTEIGLISGLRECKAWTFHEGVACKNGRGATNGKILKKVDLATCMDSCSDVQTCQGVVRRKSEGGRGKCWHKHNIQFDICQTNSKKYNLYKKPPDTGSNMDISTSLLKQLVQQSGPIFLPMDEGYEESRKLINAMCTGRPAVIVVPTTEEDVSTILKAATDAALQISVRSGGHSYTCNSIKQDGIHIDMRNFKKIHLYQTSNSPTGLAAALGTGNQWGAVLNKIPPTKFSYPHGQCRSVGVGGFLLGGGVNWLGTYNKLGYGAEYVLAMKAVLADGRIVEVEANQTRVLSPTPQIIPHTSDNNLFFALRGAGSSYAIVTEFTYRIEPKPEALPAVILAWIDSKQDLQVLQRAAQSSDDYSITISNEFANNFWKTKIVAEVYKVLPSVMNVLRAYGNTQGRNTYPVFITITDIRPSAGRNPDIIKAAKYLADQGVSLVYQTRELLKAFHHFAQYLYDTNILESEQMTPGEHNLASFYFGSLPNHDSFEKTFFTNPSFGLKRANFMEFTRHKCGYCFWMIHYRNRAVRDVNSTIDPISTNVARDEPNTIDTNLVCLFKDKWSTCPKLVEDIKNQVKSRLDSSGSSYSKYLNFPSCSGPDWAQRYWGLDNWIRLKAIKRYWDPHNVFNHCQSVGSSDDSGKKCCPVFDANSGSCAFGLANKYSRIDCGFLQITKAECLQRNCCFKKNGIWDIFQGIKECFKKTQN